MRSLALACLALLTASYATARADGFAESASGRQPGTGSLIVTGVAIIDPVNGSTSAPQDLLVEAGRIARIAPAGTVTAPTGAMRIDGTGRFVMAGLIDVHAHVGEGGAGPTDDAARARALPQFLHYGVTTIFVPGGSGANDADFAALRQGCRAGDGACPGLYGSGPLVTAPGSHPISTIFNLQGDPPAQVMEAIGVTMLPPPTRISMP